MKVMLILNLALLGLARAKDGLKVFELELSKVAVAKDEPAVQGELAERALLSFIPRVHSHGTYVVPIQIGDPPQTLWLAVYMALSMMWIEYRNYDMTDTPSEYIGFAPEVSKTFALDEAQGFEMKFIYGEYTPGDIIYDVMSVNSTPIARLMLGATPQRKIDAVGGLGLAARKENDESIQPTFLEYLKKWKLIDRRAYSLYFDLDRNSGQVIFGGVDTTKFIGELCVLTRPPINKELEGFFVGLSGIDIVTNASKHFQIGVPAEGITSLLESGSQFSYLPFSILWQIAKSIGAFFRNDSLLGISCMYKYQPNPQARVTLTLPRADGGAPVRINIPLTDLVIDVETKDPDPVCLFGIQASSSLNSPATATYESVRIPKIADFALFGQTFLWHMYVVGDIDNDQIAVAPVNFGLGPDRPTNIIELPDSNVSVSGLRGVDSPNQQGQAPPRAP